MDLKVGSHPKNIENLTWILKILCGFSKSYVIASDQLVDKIYVSKDENREMSIASLSSENKLRDGSLRGQGIE